MNKQQIKGMETDAGNLQIEQIESLSVAGNRLAKLREACGWSINDVSARLKVPSSKLLALEAGDIRQFPGLPFTIGVVRSYTRMLGVDSDPFVQVLRFEGVDLQNINVSMPQQKDINIQREHISIKLQRNSSRYRFRIWSVIVSVISFLIFAMIWTSSEKYVNKKSIIQNSSGVLDAPSVDSLNTHDIPSGISNIHDKIGT
ncbi:MAG: helix-turn-helix domain-containing protein [Burkholderia sp.]|nr:helix-turn-helix domain-containing protein [Burkholderia sp.]